MKKILIITYYWPPASGPGVQRWLKFVKYLNQAGYRPIILTVKNGGFPSIDESLINDVPENLKVYKTKTFEPFKIYNFLRGKKGKSIEVGMGNLKSKTSFFNSFANYIRSNFFIPDARIGWNKFARKKALKLIIENEIELVITTGPPHSTHLIGDYLKKKSEIKWIADFRDPWSTIFYEKFLNRNEKSKNKNLKLESQVIKNCDALVVVSQGMKEEFDSDSTKISVISNGFDPSDMEKLETQPTPYFKLSYIGNLKRNQDVIALWEAISELAKDSKFAEKFKLSFTGNVTDSVKGSIEKYGISKFVEYNSFVGHKEATRLMSVANCLYLPIPNSENNKSILTGKIFEYMASGSPILSIGPKDGNASMILMDCGRSGMFDYNEKNEIKNFIKMNFDYWDDNFGLSKKHKDNLYMKYSRENLTKNLISLIQDL